MPAAGRGRRLRQDFAGPGRVRPGAQTTPVGPEYGSGQRERKGAE